ncbi:hypothetical protein pdam_00023344 [Pocillopora damicornis]|uniref:Uncharacterized protein n=1 Tax=Pocillopora damicornis TaxID=46731 RepID=A0A3M6TEK5_POCDA|nr:hypothetical protein pdam_00023344 [Pocillopora damicornis]
MYNTSNLLESQIYKTL